MAIRKSPKSEVTSPVPDAVAPTILNPILAALISEYAEPLAVELLESRLAAAIQAHIKRLLTSQDPADAAQRQALFRHIGLIAAGTAMSEAFGAFSSDAQNHLGAFQANSLPVSVSSASTSENV